MQLSTLSTSTLPLTSPLRAPRRLWKPAACAAQAAIALTLVAGTPAAFADDGITHVPAEQQVSGESAQAPTALDVVQTVRLPIAYKTVRREDPSHYKGTERVVQQGQKGVLERTYAVVSAAGTEVSRTMLKEERTREPRTHVVAVGTKPRPRPQAKAVADGLNWPGLARCESGGNPRAVSSSGKYRGLYQFDLSTWRSVGGSGDPAAASSDEQTLRAQKLYQRAGRSPWPVCGKYL